MEILTQGMPTWAVVAIAIASYGLRWLQTRQAASPTTPTLPTNPDVPMPAPNGGDRLTIGNGLLINLFLNAFKAGLSASPTSPPQPVSPPGQSPDVEDILRRLNEMLKRPQTPAV